jgi:hypothetical protein
MFDDVFTAPHFGFEGADDYYYRVSSMRVIDRVCVPTLIVASKDDPFVPWEPFVDRRVTRNRNIKVELTDHGGHCAFVAEAGGGAAYWAESRVVTFAGQVSARRAPRSAPGQTPAQPPALRA